MDSIPEVATGWAWWFFSVVFVAVIVNLISEYLKLWLETFLERYSEERQEKGKERRRQRTIKIDKLLEDRESAIELRLRLNELLIRLAIYLVSTVGLISLMSGMETRTGKALIDFFNRGTTEILTLQNAILGIGALFVFPVLIAGLIQMRQYLQIKNLVKEYDRRRNKIDNPEGLKWP